MANDEVGVDPVAELAEEYAARYRRGERPPLTEYADKYPQLAERIREVFPLVVLMEEAGDEGSASETPEARRLASGLGAQEAEVIGGYRLLREVGRGGMGVVYEAEQISLGRHVALKVLPLRAAQAGGLERFRREAKAAARLHHTNIVPVYEVGEDGDVCYYAMQFIQGQPLDEVVEELRRLRSNDPSNPLENLTLRPARPIALSLLSDNLKEHASPEVSVREGNEEAPPQAGPDTDEVAAAATVIVSGKASSTDSNRRQYYHGVARIGVQVAHALDYAHKEGVIHRDIKPSNLLLDGTGRVWVADFGLAKTEGDALTQSGDIVGTVPYMAPERFRGWADPRSDVYSLGLTLYELLVLRPAFRAADRAELVAQVLNQEPPRLRQLDRQVPRDLATIIAKATDKEPSRRYATAGELAADLQRFLEDRPILARPTRLAEHVWRWCRRNPLVAALFVMVIVSVLGGLGASTLFALRAADRADREQQAREEKDKALRKALDEWKRAEDQLLHTRTAKYALTLNLVQRCLAENDPTHAEELLQTCAADLQGWEYHHVRQQCAVQTFAMHTGKVTGVAFHPDGELVASIGWDGLVRVWERTTGRERRRLPGHTFRQSERPGVFVLHLDLAPGGLSFSRDGKRLVSFSPDQVIVWDVATWQMAWKRDSDGRGFFGAAAFHPDGRRLAILQGQRVLIWDLHTDRVTLTLPASQRAPCPCLTFSPDGSRLAAGFGAQLLVWELATGRAVIDERTNERFHQISFSPDGKRLAADDEVRDVDTGRVVFTPQRFEHTWHRMQFSPDGRFLAAADVCINISTPLKEQPQGLVIRTRTKAMVVKVLVVWNAETGAPIAAFPGEDWNASCLACSPDGRQVATGHPNGLVRLWTVAGIPEAGGPSPVKAINGVWSPDRQRVAVFEPERITLRDPATRDLHSWPMPVGEGEPQRVLGFSGNGRSLAANRGREAWVWDVSTGRQVGHLGGLDGRIRSVFPSPDGRRLAVGFDTGPGRKAKVHLEVWDVATGQRLLTVPGGSAYVGRMDFSPDGAWVAVHLDHHGETVRLGRPAEPPMPGEGALNEYQIWEVATGRRLLSGKGPPPTEAGQSIHAILFSPRGEHLVLACADGTVRVHSAADNREVFVLRGHRRNVSGLTYTPDGRRLVSSDSKGIKVWDTTTGLELLTLEGGGIMSLAFTPDGRRLLSGLGNRTPFRVWEAPATKDARPGAPHR